MNQAETDALIVELRRHTRAMQDLTAGITILARAIAEMVDPDESDGEDRPQFLGRG